jgi:hypothetical protein
MNETVYQRPSDGRLVVEHLADGSASVVNLAGDEAHSLNQAAAAIWACCETPVTATEIEASLSEEGPASLDRAAILAALDQLERLGLVERVSGSAARVPELAMASRRHALRRLAWGSAAAAAMPFIWTLTGGEQRLHAQAPSTPIDLTGCWTGQVDDGPAVSWDATQSGSSVTGPIALDFGAGNVLIGTMSGTVTGSSVALVFNTSIVSIPGCTASGNLNGSGATSTVMNVSGLAAFSASCPDGPQNNPITPFTLTKTGCGSPS